MSKILFNLNGEQQLVEVGQGGGVTTDAQVLWDERVHGSLVTGFNVLEVDAEDYSEELLDLEGNPRLDQDGSPVLQIKRRLIFSQAKADAKASRDASINQAQINKEAREYLASTDWYVLRNIENSSGIPQDILAARAAARASVVE